MQKSVQYSTAEKKKASVRNLLEINAWDASLDLLEGLGDVLDLAVQKHRFHGAVPFVLVDSIRDPASWPESRFGFQEGVECCI